jgi:2-polyprenyl-3-methyl-5-hydroxy-6-metoxy-1,4-benzoquinol methylase
MTKKNTVAVVKNKLGYYTLKNIPSKQDLKKYYAGKYYQADEKYNSQYTKAEKDYINNKLNLKYEVIAKNLDIKKQNSLLELGAGEGWTLKYFKQKKWEVLGIDFSNYGCNTHNKQLVKELIVGDIEEKAKELIEKKNKFDLVWLDNVLEHVTNPESLITQAKNLLNANGLLVIEVPNDFSQIQLYLKKTKTVKSDYWVITPDHISYFNLESLNKLTESKGFKNVDAISDFPIEFFLFNNNSNYVINKKVGKDSHYARILIENYLSSLPKDSYLEFCRSLAKIGLGRQIIGFYKPT